MEGMMSAGGVLDIQLEVVAECSEEGSGASVCPRGAAGRFRSVYRASLEDLLD